MEHTREKLWTKGFILLILCNFMVYMVLQMILTVMPAYAKESLHANSVQVSLVTALFSLSAIAARIYAGSAMEGGSQNRNRILFVGLVVAALATAGYYWCSALGLLLVMRMCYGVGFGMASTTFPTFASDVIPSKRMGEGMGYFGLSTTFAMSLGPVIGMTLIGHYGFGTLVAVTTAVALTVIPLAYSNRNVSTGERAPVADQPGEKGKMFDRKILLPLILNLILSITYGGLLGFLALFGKETDIPNIGNFFLFNALAAFLVRPVSGKIFDKKGPVAVLPPGGLLSATGLVILSYASSMTLVIVAGLFFGLGYGMIQPSLQAWMLKVVSPQQRGMANGMFLNSLDGGVAVGSIVLGGIASATSYAMMYRLSALFMVGFVILYAGSVLVKIGRKAKPSLPAGRIQKL